MHYRSVLRPGHIVYKRILEQGFCLREKNHIVCLVVHPVFVNPRSNMFCRQIHPGIVSLIPWCSLVSQNLPEPTEGIPEKCLKKKLVNVEIILKLIAFSDGKDIKLMAFFGQGILESFVLWSVLKIWADFVCLLMRLETKLQHIFLMLRPCSVYSMVDESSDEPKLFPTRKKVDSQAFFFLRHSKKLGHFYRIGRISIEILAKSTQNHLNFPTRAIKVDFHL